MSNQQLVYEVQKEFELSRRMLRYYVRLELCLSEQIILRKIVAASIEELAKLELKRNKFEPATESALRFLMQEYGITLDDKILYEPIVGGYYSKNASRELQFIQSQRTFP